MSMYDRKNRREETAEISFTKVPKVEDIDNLTITCKKHGKNMVMVDRSKRKLPNYYCEYGCKAEVGVGRVAKVLEDKGYGFIATEGDDVFFHFSKLNGEKPVEKGDLFKFKVGFNPVTGELQATEIESLEGLRADREW